VDLPVAEDPDREDAHSTLEYRPALDGLRAVAVLAVMVEHSGVRRPGSARSMIVCRNCRRDA
jgi:peptidoglycan/LPS O-acetylase OafA/YrhL